MFVAVRRAGLRLPRGASHPAASFQRVLVVLFRDLTSILLIYFMSDSLDSSHCAAAPGSQDSLSNSRYSHTAEPCFAFSCCSFPLQRDAALQSAPDHTKAKLSFACRAQLPRDAESRARRAAPSPSQLPVFYSCLFGSHIWKIINLNVLWFCSTAMSSECLHAAGNPSGQQPKFLPWGRQKEMR